MILYLDPIKVRNYYSESKYTNVSLNFNTIFYNEKLK